MTAADGLMVVLFAGLAAYAVLGGADFGAGLWDLSRNRRQRDLVARAVGPVWEANHVWLIFVVITLFSGFPELFAGLARALAGPLSVALLGIVLRGAAFVFRQYGAPHGGPAVRGTVLWGRVFAICSLATPFALGTAGAAMLEGGPVADGSAGLWRPFVTPLALLGGLLATACCTYLAAVYLARDAERAGATDLVGRLRRRALGSAAVAGGLAATGLVSLPPHAAAELRGVALPAVAVSAGCGVAALVLLGLRRYSIARIAAAGAPTGLLAGWALAVHPTALTGGPTLAEAAAADSIAGPILGVLLAGLAIVLPSYFVLLRVLRVRSE